MLTLYYRLVRKRQVFRKDKLFFFKLTADIFLLPTNCSIVVVSQYIRYRHLVSCLFLFERKLSAQNKNWVILSIFNYICVTFVYSQNVLRPLRFGEKRAFGSNLACRSLGQKTYKSSCIWDKYWEICGRYSPTKSENGSQNLRPSLVGCCANLFKKSKIFACRL